MNKTDKSALNLLLTAFFINLILTVIKFLAGIFGNSLTMIADAMHSFSDLITDIIAYIGFKLSKKPEDSCHQFGHGKYETISALFVSAVLLIFSYDLIKTSIISIIDNKFKHPESVALIVAIISFIVKELLFRISMHIGKKLDSSIIKLNAWHQRSDALSSIAAFIGIGGAMLGYKSLDSIFAIIIAILILHIAISSGLKAINELLETSIDNEKRDLIIRLIKKNNKIITTHKLRTRKIANTIFSDIHILVDPTLSVQEGHDIASELEKSIQEAFNNKIDITVHVEPFINKKSS